MPALYFSSQLAEGVLLGCVKTEKVAEREGAIIQADCAASGPAAKWRIAIDLACVAMLTSAGLGALISIHKQCKDQGGRLAIFGLRPELQELLRMTHMHKLLAIADSREQATKLALA